MENGLVGENSIIFAVPLLPGTKGGQMEFKSHDTLHILSSCMMATYKHEDEPETTNENAPLLPNTETSPPSNAPPDEYGEFFIK